MSDTGVDVPSGIGSDRDGQPGRDANDAEAIPTTPSAPTPSDPSSLKPAARDIIADYEDPNAVPLLGTLSEKLLLTKVWRKAPDGTPTKVEPDHAARFRHRPFLMKPSGVRALAEFIRLYASFKNRAIIRGALTRPHAATKHVKRRTKYTDGNPNAPEGSPARRAIPPYFRSAPNGRSWVLLDVDDLRVPAGLDPQHDPKAAMEYVLSKLPACFHDCTCFFQWSGSMGVGLTAWKTLKAHVWFWLKEPIRDDDLKAWADSLPPNSHVDKHLFNPVQIHYTAHPEILDGLEDPFGPNSGRARETLIEKASDEVDLRPVVMKVVFAKQIAKKSTVRAQPTAHASSAAPPSTVALGAPPNGTHVAAVSTAEFLANGVAEGSRNVTLFAAACDLAGREIPRAEAEAQLLNGAARCTPPMDVAEANRTIDSAYSAPRSPSRSSSAGDRGGETATANLESASKSEFGTEIWFAEMFLDKHAPMLRWVEAWGLWLYWDADAGCWRQDDSLFVRHLAVEFATRELRKIIQDRSERVRAAEEAVSDSESKSDDDGESDEDRNALQKFQSLRGVSNALDFAKADRRVAANVGQWDADPWSLCVANGTVDLRTEQLRVSNPADYITKRSPVGFDPKSEAPTFHAFLNRVQPDKDVRGFLQRLCGYGATGSARDHVLPIFYGTGANGKTTFVEAMRACLGDHFVTAPPTLLMEQKGERHPTELAMLHGKRMVVASETPAGGKLNEQLVKSLTGGDRIIARRMRENYWSFDPTHTLIVQTNHKPKITGVDEGIWRRIRLVPWEVTIPPHERDSTLVEKLQAEAAGILAWIVRGAAEYCASGLAAPRSVLAATTEYRTAEDTLADFLTECLVHAPGEFLPSKKIHERYARWSEDAGIPESRRLSLRSLSDRLLERGYVAHRKHSARGFLGVRARAQDESGVDDAGSTADRDGFGLVPAAHAVTQLTQCDAASSSTSHSQLATESMVADAHDSVTRDSPVIPIHTRPRTHTRMEDEPQIVVTASSESRASDRSAVQSATEPPVGTDDTTHGPHLGMTAATDSDTRSHALRREGRTEPCYECHGTRFARLRDPETGPWVCQVCSPAPDPESGRWEFVIDGGTAASNEYNDEVAR